MSQAANSINYNVMVRHDASSLGYHSRIEFYFHSGAEAERKARQLRGNWPGCPVHVMLRGEVEAERREAAEIVAAYR